MTPSTSTLSASSSMSAARINGPAASRPITALKPAPMSRVDDPPAAPSHDFLKWLSDSLKGLNSSVNCALFLDFCHAHHPDATYHSRRYYIDAVVFPCGSRPVDCRDHF